MFNGKRVNIGNVKAESAIEGALITTGYTESQGAVTTFMFKSNEGVEISDNQPILSITNVNSDLYSSSDSIDYSVEKLIASDGTNYADKNIVKTDLIIPESTNPTLPAIGALNVNNINETDDNKLNDNESTELKISDTQEFFDAVNQFVFEAKVPLYPDNLYPGDIKLNIINEDNKEYYIKIFEDTNERVIFTIDDALNAGSSENINGYRFWDTYFYYNDNRTGYSVFQDGKLYRIADAVNEGLVTAEYLAGVLPGTTKIEESDPTVPSTSIAPKPDDNKPTPTAKTTVTVKKKANPIKLTVKTKTVKYKKVKKAKQTVAPITVKKAVGKVSYKKISGSKKLTLKTNGKIVVKKGTKKGTYTAKIKVTAKGSASFKSVSKIVEVKIKVK